MNKEAQDRAVLHKSEMGIEVTEKVNVEISMNDFKSLIRDFGAQEVENFLNSGVFTKEFRREGNNIKTVKEI